MTIKETKAKELGQTVGKATKATLGATTEAVKTAGEAVKDPMGAKIATFGGAMIAGTVLSMIYITDGSSFFGLKTNLLIGAIFGSLVYQAFFSKPKKKKPAQKVPNFEKLTDKEKKMLQTIQEKSDFLIWKASR